MTEYKLKDILRFHNGKNYDSVSEKGAVPIYGSGGVMGFTHKELLSGEYILLPRKGTLNNCFYINGPFWNVDTVYAVDIIDKNINCKYLFYYLKCLNLKNLDSGSTLPSMTRSAYGSIKVQLPSYSMQVKVSNLLTSIDDKITANNKGVDASERLMREIYDYWFVQFDFPDKNGRPYKTSGGKMIYNKKLKLEIPEDWNIVSLGEVIKEAQKSTIQVNEAHEKRGDIPFFTSGDEIMGFNRHLVDGFNIFMNTGGNAGVKSYYGKSSYSTDTWCISAGKYSYILYVFLTKIIDQINNNYFAGSGLRHLQKNIFKEIKLVTPPDWLLDKFNEIAENIYRANSTYGAENKKLASLRDWLLPMLMGGQVKVKD